MSLVCVKMCEIGAAQWTIPACPLEYKSYKRGISRVCIYSWKFFQLNVQLVSVLHLDGKRNIVSEFGNADCCSIGRGVLC